MSKFLIVVLTAVGIAAASLLSISCEGPAGPPGDGFGSLDDPAVMPAVVYTYPPMNSVGPYSDFYVADCVAGDCPRYSMIQLRFNKFMDISSVRRALRISSSSGGITTDTSRVVSYGGDVVMVTPVPVDGDFYDTRYEIGETYTLTLDTTARDVHGNRLAASFSMTFVPEPGFRVTAISPEEGSVEVDPSNSITLTFNATVDSSILPYLRLTPAAEYGVYIYANQTNLILNLSTPLENLTTYTVSIDSGAPDANGHTLRSRYAAEFTTVGFTVLYPPAGDGYNSLGLASAFSMTFSSVIDTASLRAAFSIDPPVDGRFIYSSFYPSTSGVSFEPRGGWDELTTYTVRLDTNFRSESGTRLAGPWSSTFTTGRFVARVKITKTSSIGTSRFPYIPVTTNGPVDSTTIAGSISLAPAVPLNVLLDVGGINFTVVPSELLAPSTEYVFKVDTTLKTMRGVRLSAPASAHFKTAPLE